MSHFKIAYVNENKNFNIKKILNKKFAEQHFAIGLYYLIKELKTKYEVAWSDDAIIKIENGEWDPKKVLVIQEMESSKGSKLIKLGAIPLIWMCFEGPFIGHWIYEKINIYGNKFYKIIIDDNNYPNINFDKTKILSLGYPCVEKVSFIRKFSKYSQKDWTSKKLIVGIWSNKHYAIHLKKIYYHLSNFNFRYIFSEIISKILSKTYKKNLMFQLIDKRIDVFLNLSKYCDFYLYGRGWNKVSETPNKLLNKMMKFKKNIFDGDNSKYRELSKKNIFKNFRFCLCFENSSSKNYISEKLYDCFKEKIIPIYLGASNIEDIIPKNCFIDYRDFKTDHDLYNFINGLDYEKANNYLKFAHNFLLSINFQRNTCEYYVKNIMHQIKLFENNYK
tara:strand:- start:2334 stop:3503 length:1170 start_codon:yes stop_codon:yes gene_type:complete